MARALTAIGLLGMISVAGALFVLKHGKSRPHARTTLRPSAQIDR